MKRTLKGIIAVILCAAMLTGCAANEEPSAPVPNSPTAEAGTTSDSGDVTMSSGDNVSSAESIHDQPETNAAEPTTADGETAGSAEQTNATSQPGQADSATAQATSTTKTTSQTKPAETPKEDFDLSWKLNSTWEEGGKKCGGYEITITNNSGKPINSWTVQLTVPSGFEITSGWNGIYTIKGTTLTVKNESYNGEISAGGTSGFGFNYSSPSEFRPGKATVNGSAASAGSVSNGNSGNDAPASTDTPATVVTIPPAPEDPKGSTPVAEHGQLSVKGTQLVDKNGKGYQLRGMSTHGITWFPDFVNEDAFRTLRDDWNTNVVRLAMYVDEWGNGQCYMNNKEGSRQLLEKGVDICIKLGMYVIIDWHVLNPGDPTAYTDEAIKFFTDMSKKYADYPNIIYEIVNEPNGNATWNGVIKPYAEKVIPVIRKNDKDAVIIVGTPTWSQDIDQALADPLKYDNVMYALHFYAATHTDWLRERAEKCVAGGLPIFVSEFGCCDASGNGANDFSQTEKWLKLLDKYGISYCNWNLANKDESSSAFKTSAKANGNWSEADLSEAGAWIRKWFRNH